MGIQKLVCYNKLILYDNKCCSKAGDCLSDDYGYFGKDLDGYVHYKKAFDRNFPTGGGGDKKPSTGKGGCLSVVIVVLIVILIIIYS